MFVGLVMMLEYNGALTSHLPLLVSLARAYFIRLVALQAVPRPSCIAVLKSYPCSGVYSAVPKREW